MGNNNAAYYTWIDLIIVGNVSYVWVTSFQYETEYYVSLNDDNGLFGACSSVMDTPAEPSASCLDVWCAEIRILYCSGIHVQEAAPGFSASKLTWAKAEAN